MRLSDISLPDVYKRESADFRLFCRWFETALSTIKVDIENLPDLYDPLRCPSQLLWLLSDTMGYKTDDRLPSAFNRLVLLYFMSMIRNRGSINGMLLAAETNLAQFNLLEYGKEDNILYDRLEDTSIPVNSCSVTPHVEAGYIDVVYFSDKLPVDACIEYVRPVGMYVSQNPGVQYNAKTRISIDARLANESDTDVSFGPTRVGHYSRRDYAILQKMTTLDGEAVPSQGRDLVYNRNSEYEQEPTINAGYRALSSLQMSNNEHIVKALINPIFGLGLTPTDVSTYEGPTPLPEVADYPFTYNLRYDETTDSTETDGGVTTIDEERTESVAKPRPAVNPIMSAIGDAISMNDGNTKYTKVDEHGNIIVVDVDNE